MKVLPFACLLILVTGAVHAEDAAAPATAKLPGHSLHGEAFNEGPRQKAELLPGAGEVHFAVTTKDEQAQRYFDQGVGQLHGFWYFEAERSFRQVAALDPECAMAFWGMAMANTNNVKRAAEFIKSAVALKAKATRREQLWIDSLATFYATGAKPDSGKRVALVKALEKLSYEFPDDLEAKAFLVWRIWENQDNGVPISSKQSVDALAMQVLAANPRHPIHHYLIHLWNGEDDQRALKAAALCGQVSPGIAHMWHMPGHTFSKLHRFADAAWQQEASARVDHAYMIGARILPEQIFNYAHNNNWLIEDLEYIGRAHEAIDLAKNMIELPRPAPKNAEPGKSAGYEGSSNGYTMGRERLLETAGRYELWPELTSLENTMYLAPTTDAQRELKRTTALALAHYAQGALEKGDATLQALDQEWQKLRVARIAAADEAEKQAQAAGKMRDQVTAAMAAALGNFSARGESLQGALGQLRLAQALARHQPEQARTLLKLAKNLTLLQKTRIQVEIGDLEQAEKTAREAVTPATEGEVLPLATLAHVLWKNGKKPEALKIFQKLIPLCAQADLDTPPFARLAPLARELQLAEDWRPKLEWKPDTGERPNLASLGPFRWHPYQAPSWSLLDKDGKPTALADFHGKPVLVMFYLGSGCARCIEQLNFFSPVAQRFSEAGILMIAVSSDSADSLHETFAKAKDGTLHFPILADPTLDTFKAYRAFDDFEKIPLHGTFLIDATGLVRWQDISFDAFRDPEWLLAEAKRLLGMPVGGSEEKVAVATEVSSKP